jgi:hypothetical protein
VVGAVSGGADVVGGAEVVVGGAEVVVGGAVVVGGVVDVVVVVLVEEVLGGRDAVRALSDDAPEPHAPLTSARLTTRIPSLRTRRCYGRLQFGLSRPCEAVDIGCMRLFVRITVAASLIGALSFSAAGAEAATAASASDFTRRVCAAVATANRSSKAPAAALKAAGQAYKTSPSATTAAGLRDALAGSIQNVDQQITTLLAAVQAAGRPTNATAFVDALSGLLQSAHGAAQHHLGVGVHEQPAAGHHRDQRPQQPDPHVGQEQSRVQERGRSLAPDRAVHDDGLGDLREDLTQRRAGRRGSARNAAMMTCVAMGRRRLVTSALTSISNDPDVGSVAGASSDQALAISQCIISPGIDLGATASQFLVSFLSRRARRRTSASCALVSARCRGSSASRSSAWRRWCARVVFRR